MRRATPERTAPHAGVASLCEGVRHDHDHGPGAGDRLLAAGRDAASADGHSAALKLRAQAAARARHSTSALPPRGRGSLDIK